VHCGDTRVFLEGVHALGVPVHIVMTQLMLAVALLCVTSCMNCNQVTIARRHMRRLLLKRSLSGWQQYVAHRRRRETQAQLATTHDHRVLQLGAFMAFRQHVAAAAQKRGRVFAAALHRRSWLLWRAFRAWR